MKPPKELQINRRFRGESTTVLEKLKKRGEFVGITTKGKRKTLITHLIVSPVRFNTTLLFTGTIKSPNFVFTKINVIKE